MVFVKDLTSTVILITFFSGTVQFRKSKTWNTNEQWVHLIYTVTTCHCPITTPLPGPVVESVASQIAYPGVVSLIPARPHTSVEIDHEIFSSHFPPSADSRAVVSSKGKYMHRVLANRLV